MFEGCLNVQFCSKTQSKTPNDVKLNALQNGYLEFSILFDFDPQNSKFLLKKMLIKSEIIKLSKKSGIYVIEIHTNNTHTKLQSNIFVFGCAIAKQPGKSDDVTFL